jgi:hypothetical protein
MATINGVDLFLPPSLSFHFQRYICAIHLHEHVSATEPVGQAARTPDSEHINVVGVSGGVDAVRLTRRISALSSAMNPSKSSWLRGSNLWSWHRAQLTDRPRNSCSTSPICSRSCRCASATVQGELETAFVILRAMAGDCVTASSHEKQHHVALSVFCSKKGRAIALPFLPLLAYDFDRSEILRQNASTVATAINAPNTIERLKMSVTTIASTAHLPFW